MNKIYMRIFLNNQLLTSSLRQTLIVLSWDELYIKSFPPHLIQVTDCVWPVKLRTHVNIIVSHIFIVVSLEDEAKYRHSSLRCSGCQLKQVIHCLCPIKVFPNCLPVSGSQIINFFKKKTIEYAFFVRNIFVNDCNLPNYFYTQKLTSNHLVTKLHTIPNFYDLKRNRKLKKVWQ